MSVVVVGAYTRDQFMYGPRLPLRGETVNCLDYAEAHGGKGANQAVAAARAGARTWLITGLGQDLNGALAQALFAEEGVDTSYSRIAAESKTGVGFIIVARDGQQLITTFAGAGAELSVADVQKAEHVIRDASVLLLQGEIGSEVSLAAAELAGSETHVVLDPSPVEAFEGVGSFHGVDILTPNDPEAVILTGTADPSAAQVAEATGISTVIITHGADGAEVFWRNRTYKVLAYTAAVVDTTGAGDAFNGALAAALDHGLDVLAAVHYACRYAAVSVGRRFCIPSYATLAEVPFLEARSSE